jgi:hypothetical protein
MGIESRSLLDTEDPNKAGLDLEHMTVGMLTQSARDRLGVRLEEKREALLCQLIWAARNLAYYNLRYLPADPFVNHDALRCDECKQEQRRTQAGPLKTEHASTCRTGAVLAIVEQLVGLSKLVPAMVDVKPFVYRSVEKPARPAAPPPTWKAFGRMDEAVQEALPAQYIAFGRSLSTGTDLYFVFDDLAQLGGREMVIMQSPKAFVQEGGAA